MDIAKIDKNFARKQAVIDGEIKYFKIPCEPFDLYGTYFEERSNSFVRMPSEITEKVSNRLNYLNTNPAGGRIRFKTNSKNIEVSVKYDAMCVYPHMPSVNACGFTLIDEDNGNRLVESIFPSEAEMRESKNTGYKVCKEINNEGKLKNYCLYLPSYNNVMEIVVGLDKDAKIDHGKKYREVKPILYYGSSITQGACASRPDNIYENHIIRWNNIDYINLGFSGNCLAEEDMAKYLSTIECSLFVCDYDHNAPDAEHLKKTHYKLYQTFRKAQPKTPILFITSPNYWDYPPYWIERERVIKKTYLRAKKEGDNNVYFLSGRTLFGNKDYYNCTVEKTHPNDIGFYRMAEKIYKAMQKIDKQFK